MRFKIASLKTFSIMPALAVLALAAAAPAAAQTADDRQSVQLSSSLIMTNRAVGVEGRMKQVRWASAPQRELVDKRLTKTMRRLAAAPDAMGQTRVWTARADICDLPGEEILMQIRSPLTCGTLGCEMVVLSDAGGAPQVVLETVGDTIDTRSPGEIIVNRGDRHERSFRYSVGEFRRMRN
ncbi:MAG: hypothetical protein KDA46_12025 [Parvularculaceae bacterium]|nr:hypothetical protein [Parvularculaceae bacterium]